MFFGFAVVMSLAAAAVWQFYQFVSFKNTIGAFDAQGGTLHFWLAVVLGLMAFATAFLFFSVFLRYDREDENHITAPPEPRKTST